MWCRALKTKHETPKYGLIYHASLIGQAAPKFKGKISRVLAAKCSLSIRVDALGESADATIGLDSRSKVHPSAVLVVIDWCATWCVSPLLGPCGCAVLLHIDAVTCISSAIFDPFCSVLHCQQLWPWLYLKCITRAMF